MVQPNKWSDLAPEIKTMIIRLVLLSSPVNESPGTQLQPYNINLRCLQIDSGSREIAFQILTQELFIIDIRLSLCTIHKMSVVQRKMAIGLSVPLPFPTLSEAKKVCGRDYSRLAICLQCDQECHAKHKQLRFSFISHPVVEVAMWTLLSLLIQRNPRLTGTFNHVTRTPVLDMRGQDTLRRCYQTMQGLSNTMVQISVTTSCGYFATGPASPMVMKEISGCNCVQIHRNRLEVLEGALRRGSASPDLLPALVTMWYGFRHTVEGCSGYLASTKEQCYQLGGYGYQYTVVILTGLTTYMFGRPNTEQEQQHRLMGFWRPTHRLHRRRSDRLPLENLLAFLKGAPKTLLLLVFQARAYYLLAVARASCTGRHQCYGPTTSPQIHAHYSTTETPLHWLAQARRNASIIQGYVQPGQSLGQMKDHLIEWLLEFDNFAKSFEESIRDWCEPSTPVLLEPVQMPDHAANVVTLTMQIAWNDLDI